MMAQRPDDTGPDRRPRTTIAALAALAAVAALAAALLPPGIAGGLAISPDLRWFFTSVAVAFLLVAQGCWNGTWGFGLMAGAVILGGTAQLFITDPLWFPAPRLRPRGAVEFAMIGLIALEGLAALAVLSRFGIGPLWRAVRDAPGLLAVIVIILAGSLFSISIMPYAAHGNWSDYAQRLVAGGVLTGLHLAALAALMTLRPSFDTTGGIHPVYGAALAFMASLALGALAFQHMPHVEDELAYLFQARTFASGHLSAAAPAAAIQPGLTYYLLQIDAGRWFSVTAPGWPLALALGVAAGMPWLVNPLLAGLSVLFGYGVIRRHAGATTAGIAALLMATSPWLAASGASLMTHALTTTLILFAWWAILKGRESRDHLGTGWLLAAGLAMGWVFATRPLDGLIAGLLTTVWLLLSGRNALIRTIIYGLGCIVAGSSFLIYNHAMTGHFTTAPLDAYLVQLWGAGANAFGFGPRIGPPGGWGALDLAPGHSPTEGVINTLNNLSSLQFDMMGWSVGSLAPALLWITLPGKRTRFDHAMLIMALVTIAAMFPYWFAGSFYIGPRYWFLAAFPLIHLSARGVAMLEAQLTARGHHGRVGPMLVVLAIFAALVFTPWRGVTKYHDYGNFHDEIAQADALGTFGNAIVLVSGKGDPGSYLYLNRPDLPADRPIYLTDTGALDTEAIRAAYPDRKVIRFTTDWSPSPK